MFLGCFSLENYYMWESENLKILKLPFTIFFSILIRQFYESVKIKNWLLKNSHILKKVKKKSSLNIKVRKNVFWQTDQNY